MRAKAELGLWLNSLRELACFIRPGDPLGLEVYHWTFRLLLCASNWTRKGNLMTSPLNLAETLLSLHIPLLGICSSCHCFPVFICVSVLFISHRVPTFFLFLLWPACWRRIWLSQAKQISYRSSLRILNPKRQAVSSRVLHAHPYKYP